MYVQGQPGAVVYSVVTHLGRHLKCGDSVLGYDVGSWYAHEYARAKCAKLSSSLSPLNVQCI
jgi:hypothetical protein